MNRKEFFKIFRYPRSILNLNYSFSQEGEDMIVDTLLDYKKKGFYVDLGAHHPTRFSNTMRFYCRGWNGINIDATPGSMKYFDRARPRDINIEMGISDKEDELIYYEFNDSALNTFNENTAKHCEEAGYVIKNKVKIKTNSVMQLLGKYLQGKTIDILDIDIEGFDDIIIETWDWDKYKPTIVLIEKTYDDRNKLVQNDVLLKYGYVLAGMTSRTSIYFESEGNRL